MRPFCDDKASPGTFVGFESPHIIQILTQEQESTPPRVVRATAVHFQEYYTIRDAGRKLQPILDDSDLPFYEEIENNDNIPKKGPKQTLEPASQPNTPTKASGRLRRSAQRNARIRNDGRMLHEPAAIVPKAIIPPNFVLRRSGRTLRRSVRALFSHRDHQFHPQTKPDLRNQLEYTSNVALLAVRDQRYSPSNQFALLAKATPAEPYEPTSWKSAMNRSSSDKWLQAAQDEYSSLLTNNTWNLVQPPLHQKVLTGRWVFKYKRGVRHQILRYKARFVVKGFEQQFGVDYNETFASVVKPMSYKALFAIAASLDLEIEQMDVKTAFLYGSIEDEIYVEQPEGFNDNSGRVCRLNKALYGLKQSPRVWYTTLSEYLQSLGFKALDADNSVFSRGSVFIAVYVDDLLIAGNDIAEINSIKKALSDHFSMADLGPVAFYLGMTITRDRARRILRIGQQAYLSEAIRNCSIWEAICPATPMTTTTLEPAGEDYRATPEFKARYQSYVGTLMYAMLGSRPDIAFSVSCVSRYAANPTKSHMTAVLRIFAYLHGTLEYQLTYRGELEPLHGFSDSDFAGDKSTSRSTAGFVFNLGSGAISWSAKRQPTVALSTCEAEYGGQTQAAKEAVWLRQLLRGLNPTDPIPYATIIYCDNQGAIALAKDPRFHPRTKHIGVQHHWIREQIASESVQLEYISTAKQVADGLTKALPRRTFEVFREALGLEAC